MGTWRRDVISFACVFGLLSAVYLLPPDTALREVQSAGALRVCLPPLYPPLVTDQPNAPGIDIELLRLIATRLDVRLITVTNAAMGTDFNPRSWHVSRSQCEVLAGGVVGSPMTRSFLDVSQPYAETGWSWVSPRFVESVDGRRVGVLVGVSGLDRIGLAARLRAANATVTITLNSTELVEGLTSGRFDVGVTEHLLAGTIAARQGWNQGWMPSDLNRYPIVLGLWKGDLTLKRAVVSTLNGVQQSGELATIIGRYTQAHAESSR